MSNSGDNQQCWHSFLWLAGRLNLQIRFEFYNLLNHHNLYLENDLAAGGFGKAISEQLPRWWQLGAKFTF